MGGVTGGGTGVPDVESVADGGRADVVGVRGPGEVKDALRVAGEAVKES